MYLIGVYVLLSCGFGARKDILTFYDVKRKSHLFHLEKINLTHMLRFNFDKLEYILGKGEIVGCQHFLLVPKCFHKALVKSLKLGIVWYRFYHA